MVEQHVTVSGRNMEIGEALVVFVSSHIEALSQKYFNRMVTSRIVFTKMPKGHSYICNIQVSIGHDMHYAAEAQFDTVHRAFKRSYERLAKQLRRKKREKHEDKPNGHQKEVVLNELLRPDPIDLIVHRKADLPIDGNDLSIADAGFDDGVIVVQAMYGKE